MYSACGSAVLPALGFPIRESADHGLFSASPRLIAAVHALLRLLVPRHPPCALPILTVITRPARSRTRGDTRLLAWLCSFQGPQRGARPDWALGLSKLNSMRRSSLRSAPPGPVDISVVAATVGTRPAGHAVIPVCWHCCAVFKVREEPHAHVATHRALGLSKLNSMGRARRARAPPGPVDVSVVAPAAGSRPGPFELRRRGMRRPLSDRSNPGASLERR